MKTYLVRLSVLLTLLLPLGDAVGQIVINGVNNRTVYTDQATFQVVPQAGFSYEVTLNGQAMPVGSSVVVERMDHYELIVTATPNGGGTPVSELRQFIVRDSDRGSPETGLIKWVPYPPISSADTEFAGANLELISPPAYPIGLPVPFVAFVEGQGQTRRVNGRVSLGGSDLGDFRLVRGVGFGLVPTTNRATFTISAQVGPLTTSRLLSMETPTWTPVSGTLPALASWTDGSRISVTGNLTIPAGGQLEIEAGTVVRLMPGVNITNNGRILLRGSKSNPIVFTATNKVAPEVHSGAWGGFVMRNAGAEIAGEGAIFTGSGGAASFSFSPGTSHRAEQALFLAQAGTRVQLTNCYMINQAGQIANGYNADVTYDHCLLQRAITAGEYVGGTIVVNHSAVIEFPAIDDVYNATIADSDYDAIYFTTGTHVLKDSLFGFCKDDAIDSGSGGPGTVVVTNCWVESALHEGMAWSGEGRQTWTYDTISLNNGQGFECGWSTGSDSPLCWGERLLLLGNSVGARYGDNYEGTTGLGLKTGFLWVTNSIVLNNYRDVWGRVWDDTWNYRVNRMDIRDNWLTAVNTNHLENSIWNPATDANRLAPYLRTPTDAGVGVALAVWSTVQARANITNGVPVRLSSFSTKPVTINYTIDGPKGPVQSGALTFSPGQMVRRIDVSAPIYQANYALRVTLLNPAGGQLTGPTEAWYLDLPVTPPPPTTTLIARGSVWRYRDTASAAPAGWQTLAFSDTTWPSGPAQLGFSNNEERDEATLIADNDQITSYFRQGFTVADPTLYSGLSFWMLRDDAGVVYLNGTEIFRSPNLPAFPAAITYATTTSSPNGENTIDTGTTTNGLRTGSNMLAVEIHQQSATSSDVSFDFELLGLGATPAPRLEIAPFGSQVLLFWGAPGYVLESAPSVTGPWTFSSATAPVAVTPTQNQFYRLRR
jgi:hypothetical protein